MHVLVVDDNAAVRDALELMFVVNDVEVRVAASPAEAVRQVQAGGVGVVVQDMNFRPGATSGEEGRALFAELRRLDPDLRVVLLTAWANLAMAVDLMRQGADDYVEKPWDDQLLVGRVRQLLLERQAGAAADGLQDADLAGLVWASPQMQRVVRLALRVAPSTASVLITGPSGVGKERLAEVLHANSGRAGPLVAVDCGAIPATLLEGELFGAERGAYTGADRARLGHFRQADGGSLFLDEIGNLSAEGQAALLRVLETGRVRPLGADAEVGVDVRVLAATNVDLLGAVQAGGFREDLYYRLAVVEVAVPPLQERPQDVDALADHFLASHGLSAEALEGTARRALREQPWGGNARELRNAIERAVLTRTSERIGVADLGLAPPAPELGGPEAERIRAALREANGVVSKAAEALGLSRQALYRRMARLGLSLERRVR
ncbi:MAG: sigma-54 dependent transcriptional regulator [Myxococcales bacterium]|nr:sigma-54 dependent transcriptional regulator [Myxococcales bacterium]